MKPALHKALLLSMFIFMLVFNAWAKRICVKADASGSNNGTSWANAYINLQDALTLAANGDSILVASGTYRPHATDRKVSFNIPGKKVFGGFAGNEYPINEDAMNSRNFSTHETILSGDLAGDDNSGGNNSENSFHVVYYPTVSSPTVLDGFTITSGNADSAYQTICDRGAGIYIAGSVYDGIGYPLLKNLVIKGNTAVLGAGLYNNAEHESQGSPHLMNITFQNNTSTSKGGGLYNRGEVGKSAPVLKNVAFINNSASGYGGAIYNLARSGSSTYDSAHGLCFPIIKNALFYGNTAGTGGGIYNECGDYVGSIGGICKPVIINATFYGNSGTAIASIEANMNSICEVTLKNSILWNNGNEISNSYNGATTRISYCCIYNCFINEGWNSSYGTNGSGNFKTYPEFSDTANRNFSLKSSSPCINTGDPDTLTLGLPLSDLAGNPRIYMGCHAHVDMGAYEFQGESIFPYVEALTPTAGVQWNAGTTHDITWFACDDAGITSYVIQLRVNGDSYTTLDSGSGNPQTWSWTLPTGIKTSPQSQIRIDVYDSDAHMAVAPSGTFSIFNPERPVVTITSPTSNVGWHGGSTHDITWTATDNVGIMSYAVDFSVNYGNSFSILDSGTGNPGTYSWTLPTNVASFTCIMRLRVYDGDGYADTAEMQFNIEDTIPPFLQLISPNGEEAWSKSANKKIRWVDSDNVAMPYYSTRCSIYVSTNNKLTWTKLYGGLCQANDSQSCTMPDTISDSCWIRIVIVDKEYNVSSDTSDRPFRLVSQPYFDCPDSIQVKYGIRMGFHAAAAIPDNGTHTIAINAIRLPAWATLANDSVSGIPNVKGKDTIKLELKVDGTAYDTLTLRVFVVDPTGIFPKATPRIPSRFGLSVYSPTGNDITFVVAVEKPSDADLMVYNAFGKKLWTYRGKGLAASYHKITWNHGITLHSGTYFAVLTRGDERILQKLAILR